MPKENNEQTSVSGEVTSHTSCKNTSKGIDTANNLSCVEYTYNIENKTLKITHINTGFNCCPGNLYCEVELIGDTIEIQEFEEESLCNCLCLFDMDIEVNNVECANYILKFVEPYCDNQEQLIFAIDLNSSINGCYCVTRHDCPWGVIY